jgi:hypothetical protein
LYKGYLECIKTSAELNKSTALTISKGQKSLIASIVTATSIVPNAVIHSFLKRLTNAEDSRLCEMEEKHLKDMKDLEVKMDQRCCLMDRECYGK